MSLLGHVFVFLVKIYQGLISPWLPATCRHQPTCSKYTIQAIQEWGALKGGWMGLKRIGKCHPWGTHGFDPVPKRDGADEQKGKS